MRLQYGVRNMINQSSEEVLQNLPNKYDISIEDIAPLKGKRIFNVKLYM